jgi:hypothetical protein
MVSVLTLVNMSGAMQLISKADLMSSGVTTFIKQNKKL